MALFSFKRILSISLGIFLITISAFADPVSFKTAKKVAVNYMVQQSENQSLTKPTVYPVSLSLATNSKGESPYFYLFTSEQGGFTIVAGDDRAYPILGYSTNGFIEEDNIPRAAQKWLEEYKQQIEYLVKNEIEPTNEILKAWKELEDGIGQNSRKKTVSPLLKTTWNQGGAYNDMCPSNSVTGCVATAMAQVMKYHAYPAKGRGFHSYNHSQYGTLSANFGGTTYNWSSMPNNVTSSNNAVATIMYHCGVSVEMDYSPQSSGAYVISDQSPVTHCAEYAFEEYFGYPTGLEGVQRVNYSETQWINLLKKELDNNRPILYAGFGNGGGHAFVCDGYDGSDYFHFNWGWGGAYDGYFAINALNPTGTGTGGGTGGYNSGHQAIIGVEPPSTTVTNDIVLYDYVEPSNETIYYGQEFDVFTNVANNGDDDFDGDFCAAAFDDELNFVEYIEIKTGFSLESGYTYTNGLTFSTDGLLSMLPGTYYIGIFFRPTSGKWTQVSDYSNYENLVELEVINPNDIELYSDMVVSPGTTITQGKKIKVNVNVLNDGSSTFTGEYQVNLYDLEGKFIQAVGSVSESDGLPPNYTYVSPFLEFTSDEIDAEPGTYLLAMIHKESGGSWEITGSSYYQNPIKITVQSPPIPQDNYEDNNTVAKAYKMALSFSADKANTFTSNANIHIEDDVDYYKIDLESNYNYEISARINDALDTDDNKTYTLDALVSYSFDGENWSDPFDDVISDDITKKQGGTLFFKVAPYFAGEKGTYTLKIDVTRQLAVTINEPKAEEIEISLYPNPASNDLYIETNSTIENVRIYSSTGKLIETIAVYAPNQPIDVSALAAGSYYLMITSDQKSIKKAFNVVK
jgi:hypothetical protein